MVSIGEKNNFGFKILAERKNVYICFNTLQPLDTTNHINDGNNYAKVI